MKHRTPLKVRIRAVIMALLLASGLFTTALVTAPAALATSSSTPTADYPWAHDGCTHASDEPVAGASFTDACNKHDGCYGDHWASRAVCDAWFLSDMRNACDHLQWESNWRYLRCRAFANAYHAAARVFGYYHYYSSSLFWRYSTPICQG